MPHNTAYEHPDAWLREGLESEPLRNYRHEIWQGSTLLETLVLDPQCYAADARTLLDGMNALRLQAIARAYQLKGLPYTVSGNTWCELDVREFDCLHQHPHLLTIGTPVGTFDLKIARSCGAVVIKVGGILTPSYHSSQNWLFRLQRTIHGDGSVTYSSLSESQEITWTTPINWPLSL